MLVVETSSISDLMSLFIFFCCCLHHGVLQRTLGSDGKAKEPESNVLLASIENMQYAVGVDVLHTVRVI